MNGLGKTGIPYADYRWPLVTGCSPAGAACDHCYAAKYAATRGKHLPQYAGLAHERPISAYERGCGFRPGYQWTGEVRFHADQLERPLHTKKPGRVFTVPTGDLFHEGVTDEQVYLALAVMAATPHLDYVIVTKRMQRVHDMLSDRDECCSQVIVADTKLRGLMAPLSAPWPLPNVWLVPTVWDQASADRVIRLLLDTPAAVRGISYEPALGPVDPTRVKLKAPRGNELDALQSYESEYIGGGHRKHYPNSRPSLDWVIVGGENGPGARPMDPAWTARLVDQCDAASVPVWFKGWGRVANHMPADDPIRVLDSRRDLPGVTS